MMDKYYVYIHVKDGKVIYCGKGIKKVCNCGKLYDRAYEGKGRKYNIKEVEVFKVKYFDNEQQALEYEEKLTDYFKSIGQCEFNINIANKHGEETRKKMSGENNPMYGKHFSEEARKKMSESKKGKTGANCPNSIPIVAFTDSSSYYKEFACTMDAERELGVGHSSISKCCKGKLKSAGKYNGEPIRWKYKE